MALLSRLLRILALRELDLSRRHLRRRAGLGAALAVTVLIGLGAGLALGLMALAHWLGWFWAWAAVLAGAALVAAILALALHLEQRRHRAAMRVARRRRRLYIAAIAETLASDRGVIWLVLGLAALNLVGGGARTASAGEAEPTQNAPEAAGEGAPPS